LKGSKGRVRKPDQDRAEVRFREGFRMAAGRDAPPDGQFATAALTTFAGLLLGVFVTLSSAGAGAIGMTALVLLYPRTAIARLVGSDIGLPARLRGA
jgi:hypothetical protein